MKKGKILSFITRYNLDLWTAAAFWAVNVLVTFTTLVDKEQYESLRGWGVGAGIICIILCIMARKLD